MTSLQMSATWVAVDINLSQHTLKFVYKVLLLERTHSEKTKKY